MIVPFLGYIIGLFAVGFIHKLLSPVADAMFAASTNPRATMTMLHSAWTYMPHLYAIFGGAVLLFLYAQKSGGGPFG